MLVHINSFQLQCALRKYVYMQQIKNKEYGKKTDMKLEWTTKPQHMHFNTFTGKKNKPLNSPTVSPTNLVGKTNSNAIFLNNF